MRNKKIMLPITVEMIRAVNISTGPRLTAPGLTRVLVIIEINSLEIVPEKLLELFAALEISGTIVCNVLLGDNDIAEALMARRE